VKSIVKKTKGSGLWLVGWSENLEDWGCNLYQGGGDRQKEKEKWKMVKKKKRIEAKQRGGIT